MLNRKHWNGGWYTTRTNPPTYRLAISLIVEGAWSSTVRGGLIISDTPDTIGLYPLVISMFTEERPHVPISPSRPESATFPATEFGSVASIEGQHRSRELSVEWIQF